MKQSFLTLNRACHNPMKLRLGVHPTKLRPNEKKNKFTTSVGCICQTEKHHKKKSTHFLAPVSSSFCQTSFSSAVVRLILLLAGMASGKQQLASVRTCAKQTVLGINIVGIFVVVITIIIIPSLKLSIESNLQPID